MIYYILICFHFLKNKYLSTIQAGKTTDEVPKTAAEPTMVKTDQPVTTRRPKPKPKMTDSEINAELRKYAIIGEKFIRHLKLRY